MPARTAQQVIARLQAQPPALYHRGKRVADITTEPGIKNGVHSLADLYDHQWIHRDQSLYTSPTSGDPVSITFQIPTTVAELTAIGDAMQMRAAYTLGMMGRMPDHLNRAMMGYAGSADFLRVQGDHFAENMRRYYEYLRENDLCLTHTLVNPQNNRAVGMAKQADPFLAARVKEETDAGIVVRGARMLATLPISDEIMVYPSNQLRSQEEDAPYAFGFAIPNDTPGLKFQCRETVDYGASHHDHPLGSRYEELDAVVIFDDVFVPWDGSFCIAMWRSATRRTGRRAPCSTWPITWSAKMWRRPNSYLASSRCWSSRLASAVFNMCRRRWPRSGSTWRR